MEPLDFVNQVCDALAKAVESASVVTMEGKEREYRHLLVKYLFEKTLNWEGYCKVGEIYDVWCIDDESFPVVLIETKWGVELTPEMKEKLRRRVEELGSVRYGVLTNEREFIIYSYSQHKLHELSKIRISMAIGYVKKGWELSNNDKDRILKIRLLKREFIVKVIDISYFTRTYKEVPVSKKHGIKLLALNLETIVEDLTNVLVSFFDSYLKRKDHYSGGFLEKTFDSWLRISMKGEEFKKSDDKKRTKVIEVFCRETAYVLLGRILFTRMCEDKEMMRSMFSGDGISESLEYYGKRKVKNIYLHLFNESREEIRNYYRHLHRLGFFDWWIIEELRKGTLSNDYLESQENLERDLDFSIGRALKRLNRFDFSNVNRDILGDVYQGYLPPNERKQLGEFYTPKEVIDFILDSVGFTSKQNIRGKLVLDPSCGSGSFLVEVAQRLIESYKGAGLNPSNPDDAQQIINGCINSIYGLDIHPFACFIAEMNLLFQLVELYDVVRQKHQSYELPRIKIFSTDSLLPSGRPLKLIEFFENSRHEMLIEETKGADRIKNMKFNFVIGNPPYVRKERILPSYKNTLKEVFPEVYQGDADLYVYFLSSGVEWLEENGKLGYIVSNKFIKARYGRKIRDFIPRFCILESFVDFGDTSVFKEATNYPAILVLTKEKDDKKRSEARVKVVAVHREMSNPVELVDHIQTNISEQEYSDDYVDIFDAPQVSEDKDWNFAPKSELRLVNKIDEASNVRKLVEILDVKGGLETGRNKVYCFENKRDALQENLEDSLLKASVTGEDVRKWDVDYKGRMVLYVSNINLEEYPSTKTYLEKHRSILDPLSEKGRKSVMMRKKKWYEIRKPVSSEILESDKLITPDISTKNNFAYDDKKYYCRETCFILTLNIKFQTSSKRKNRKLLKYFLGVLNSSLIEFYFKHVSPFISGGYYRYRKQYLEKIPIVEMTNENENATKKISQTVDRIVNLKTENYSVKLKINAFPISYVKEEWESQKLVDLAVTHLSRKSYTFSKKHMRTDFLRNLDGKEVFRITLATNEFIDFYTDVFASYVLELLKMKKTVTRRELLELKLPPQSHLGNLMREYSRDTQQVIKNNKEVTKFEKQIDDLTYNLYGLSYKERGIVEKYLEKF